MSNMNIELPSDAEVPSKPVESMGLLCDKLDELANIALDRRRSSRIGTPEWDYEEGRRNGLRTAQKLLLAMLTDNDTDHPERACER